MVRAPYRLVLGIAVLSSAVQPLRAQSLSQAGARARADIFLQSVAAGLTTKPTTHATMGPGDETQGKYWRERFLFVAMNNARVAVDMTSGSITYFYNADLTSRTLRANRPSGAAMSKHEAVTRGTAVLAAAGALADLGQPQALLNQMGNPPTFAGHTWTIVFPRVFQDVPFRNQQASVILLAEAGEVIGMGLSFPTPKPSRAAFSVASATALQGAKKALAAHQISGTTDLGVEKTFVQPNKWWSGNSLDLVGKSSDAPIPAWKVRVRQGTQIHEVWIDAGNGSVVGGESAAVSRNSRKDRRKRM